MALTHVKQLLEAALILLQDNMEHLDDELADLHSATIANRNDLVELRNQIRELRQAYDEG